MTLACLYSYSIRYDRSSHFICDNVALRNSPNLACHQHLFEICAAEWSEMRTHSCIPDTLTWEILAAETEICTLISHKRQGV